MKNPKKMNIVGSQLQLLRKWRGWSQARLSSSLRALGWKISRDALAQMEITTKRITDCDLIFLAKALDVKISDFFPTTFSQQDLRPRIKSRRLMKLRHPHSRPKKTGQRRFNFN